MSLHPVFPSLHLDRAGVIRPDLIPLAALLCSAEYGDYARAVILEPGDLEAAEEALRRGGPAPSVESAGAPAPISGGAPSLAEADDRPVAPHAPGSLVETVDHEATAYGAWGTPTGDFLARQMERLAQLLRWTGAATPGDHEARMEVWDDDLRRQWEDRGYAAGREAGRREGRDLAFQELALVLKRAR